MNPDKLAQVASAAAGGAKCLVLERTGAGSVFTLVVTDFFPSQKGEAKIRLAVDRAKPARLSYLIRYEQFASESVRAFAAAGVAGAMARMEVIVHGKITPRSHKLQTYAAAASGGGAGRAEVIIRGKLAPRAISIHGYVATCQQGTAGRVSTVVRGRIAPKTSSIKGYAKAQATQSVQRVEVTVKGGNT